MHGFAKFANLYIGVLRAEKPLPHLRGNWRENVRLSRA